MAKPDNDHSAVLTRHRHDRAVLAVVFLLLFVFSYSEDIAFAVLDATGHDHVVGWIIGLVGLDVAVLTVAGRLKLSITRVDGDPPRLWRWWWSAFAAVVVLDVVLCLLPEDHSLWIDLFASVAFAGIMGILMAVSLNADPVTLFSRSRRSEAPTRLGTRPRHGPADGRHVRVLHRRYRLRRLLRPRHRAQPRSGACGRSRRDATVRAARRIRDPL